MHTLRGLFALAVGSSLFFFGAAPLSLADEPTDASGSSQDEVMAEASENGDGDSSSSEGSSESKPKYPPHSVVLKDTKPVDGFLKLHKGEEKLFAELTPAHLNRDMLVIMTIAKGIGQTPFVGGYSWGFDDDGVWQFRKVGEKIHLVRRNIRFTAEQGSPEFQAVGLSYTDSILFSLPIATRGPSGGYVIDLSPVFMSDLPQISSVLRGFSFTPSRSTWADVKGYDDNVEVQVAATYASGGGTAIESVADTRGVTINVHYSISGIPNSGYKPRLADDRVGYFLTVLKDYSKKGEEDQFVRYINRWDLQKADSKEDISPPKDPIIFYLEKTIPVKYRKPIRDGILEWNKAFQQAGYYDAIQVRQQEKTDSWDPEDVNYNTFRWITAGAGFAMGPSRVNPLTGQILDADIIFDSDFLQYWKEDYETFTPESIAAMTGGPLDLTTYKEQQVREHMGGHNHSQNNWKCTFCNGMSHQFALGATVMAARGRSPEDMEKLIMQGLKEVTMHEVGHTLGLRHNFKSSSALTLAELSDPEKTGKSGMTASVMDYAPAHIVTKEMKQGDYFSTTIGPYDMWAIEFGYKPFSGDEEEELKKIASRSGQPELVYATDEDTRGIDPDPTANRWDLSGDQIDYAKMQAQLVAEAWPGVIDSMIEDGDGFQRARQAFGVLLSTHGRAMHFASRYVGGLYVSRSHKGDKDAPAPFEVVDVEKQREAISLLEEQVFNDKPFQFPPELYNHLAATRWDHWGSNAPIRTDYAVHSVISMWQERILAQLLSSLTLERLHDSELKVPADQDAFTTAELLERLTKAIFSEVDGMNGGDYSNRNPAISSLRRNLQRSYMRELSNLALGNFSAPQDCQTVAYSQLSQLEERIKKVLDSDVELDAYTQAHLEETAARVHKVIDARLLQLSP